VARNNVKTAIPEDSETGSPETIVLVLIGNRDLGGDRGEITLLRKADSLCLLLIAGEEFLPHDAGWHSDAEGAELRGRTDATVTYLR
jgi:hypothetical protein